MSRYRGNVAAIKDLVRPAEVHRDVYIDEEVFQLEMEHLFANTWVYVGHDSQVPNPGDYFGTTIGTPAGPDGAPHRRHGEGPAQPLPAQGHAHHHRDLRQHRQVLPLPLPCLELPDRRLADRDSAARGLREHRLRTEPRRERHERRSATCTTTAASSSPSSTTSAPASRSSSATACRASTTWSTARRSASSKSPAACCATCTIAIGRCWSRTRPTPAIR